MYTLRPNLYALSAPSWGKLMIVKDRLTQSSKALMALRDRIFDGTIQGGERLYEVALSETLGLSRTPLREALGRLEQEGLVDRIASGGYMVRSFSFADVVDAIELRGVLEGTAARLAAERGVGQNRLDAIKATVAALDEVVPAEAEQIDFGSYVTLNARFHEQLADLCGGAVIRRELERVTNLPFASPSAFLEVQETVPAFRRSLWSAQAQHRDIIEAIERRQSARAEAITREHATLARRNLDYIQFEDRSLMARVPGLSLVTTR